MEDFSVTGCLHMFVTEYVNSGEKKINSIIVVVSSLNFLIEEQIASMNVFKGTENVAIAAITALYKMNKFSATICQ